MEEFDLKDLFNYFINKKYIVAIIILAVLLIGVCYSAVFKTPMYKSYTTILLTTENKTITSSDITLNKNLVDTYREIVTSRKVINKVIKNLSLDYTIEQLQDNVTVANIKDTEIIKITVISENAKEAKNIADEIAEVFNSEVVKLYNIQNIGVIDSAEVSNNPYNINMYKTILVSLLLGIFTSLAVVLVIYYFDNTIKSTLEVETKLGLPVIGSIPMGGNKNE